MTTRPATSNHTTYEINSMTSCKATAPGTMRGSVDDVTHGHVPRHDVSDSADDVEPGDVRPATPCDNDEMTPHMTSSPDIPWHKRRLL